MHTHISIQVNGYLDVSETISYKENTLDIIANIWGLALVLGLALSEIA